MTSSSVMEKSKSSASKAHYTHVGGHPTTQREIFDFDATFAQIREFESSIRNIKGVTLFEYELGERIKGYDIVIKNAEPYHLVFKRSHYKDGMTRCRLAIEAEHASREHLALDVKSVLSMLKKCKIELGSLETIR